LRIRHTLLTIICSTILATMTFSPVCGQGPVPPSPPPIPESGQPARPGPGAGPAPGVRQQQAVSAAPRNAIQMNFDSIELRDLIRFISTIMGRNFVFDENVVKGKVTILSPKDLSKDEVLRVFETVMNYFGFSVVATPEAMKIVKGTDMKGMAIEKLDKERVTSDPPSDKPATYVHFLDYLDSNTMVGILRPMMSRDAYIVGVAATNALILIDSMSNIQRLKAILAEVDVPLSKQLSTIRVYNVQHTNAADLGKVLQALLAEGKKAQTPKDKIFVTSYPATNALLISAPPEDMKEIERIISEIDTLRPQVLVEAAIVEVTTSKGTEFGVEWLTGVRTSSDTGVAGGFVRSDGSLLGVASALVSSDAATAAKGVAGALQSGFNIGVIGPSISLNGATYPSVGAFVKALSTRDNVNILSTPQLLTKDNEEAEVVIGENRPYLTSSRLDVAGTPTYSYDYRDVGVKLKIKPTINKDGFVYLNLYQEVSQVTEATTGGTSSQPAPTTLKRSTKTTVVVKDSQTVVISGLIKDNTTGNEQGIPFLSSIPVLGRLFGYKKTVNEKTNLLVFLTPRIIYTPESLTEISTQKREEQEQLLIRNKK
jgi:general secretion pathway protein D